MQGNEATEEYSDEISFGEAAHGGWRGRLNSFLDSRYFWTAVLVLVAIISFSLGRISGLEQKREPVKIISESKGEVKGVATNPPDPLYNKGEIEQQTMVVGSKSGTKYHLPTCPGAKQISEKNKITFNSIEEARAKGYTPASNCKGLK